MAGYWSMFGCVFRVVVGCVLKAFVDLAEGSFQVVYFLDVLLELNICIYIYMVKKGIIPTGSML